MSEIKPMMAALGRVPSGLFIVTVRHREVETGLLASWIQQCSFDPPRISLAVKRGRDVLDCLVNDTIFTVNLLDRDQTDMIAHFGRGFKPGEPAFQGLEVTRPDGIPPVLEEALAYLACRVVGRHAAGDHDLIIGDVIAGQVLREGPPMVHIRKTGAHY